MSISIDVLSFVIGMVVMYFVTYTIRAWINVTLPKIKRTINSMKKDQKDTKTEHITI